MVPVHLILDRVHRDAQCLAVSIPQQGLGELVRRGAADPHAQVPIERIRIEVEATRRQFPNPRGGPIGQQVVEVDRTPMALGELLPDAREWARDRGTRHATTQSMPPASHGHAHDAEQRLQARLLDGR
ncbi:hypothetical protein D7Y13_16110 [Corallococcus praedator]|uniref:Uncharacterized protein n=1 Tax=Corallococcus praedator TaxID=2316724 RepID=A0ABX9QHP2_9BACT|nr:hypothetical protein D7X75_24180 [Corallococcus sp. CA031C]RKI08370.1 hypothetical protein D7Y13_16110 [Corallococcus praedator]